MTDDDSTSPVPSADPPAPSDDGATTSEIWVPPPDEPKRRRPVALYDRAKLLVLMVAWFVFSLWRLKENQPTYTLSDAFIVGLRDSTWLLVLAGIELVRQIHYVVSERRARYNHFWMERVWGALDRWKERRNPWLRYRTARITKWIALYLVVAFIFAARTDRSLFEGVSALPGSVLGFLTNGPDQMPFWVSLVFPLFFIVGQFGLLFWFLSRGGVDVYMPEDITTTFDDVWGQDRVVEKVKENLVFLENPKSIEDKGGHVPGGLLLWGPPGTGKTLMAEAVAGETGKPYVFVDPGAFINMFMGVGILKVKSLFRKLRKLSLRYGGVIVFFDEADSLGNRGALGQGGVPGGAAGAGLAADEHFRWLSPSTQRLLSELERSSRSDPLPDRPGRLIDKVMVAGMGGGGGGGMGTLQALLTEVSGLKKPRGIINRYVRRFLGMKPKPPFHYRILIMMATNLPEALDEALLRPGRLDRIYKVGYPSRSGRRKTYEGYLRKVRHELTDEQIDRLAEITPYATGATIKDLVNEALIRAIAQGRDTVTWKDVIGAKHFRRLGPSQDVEYVDRERHAIAIHEACHAITAYRVRSYLPIDLATIERTDTAYGFVSSISHDDVINFWRTDQESDILVSLASLAGERLFFDGNSSAGVSGDLRNATSIVARMEGYWGMGDTVTSHDVSRQLQIGGGGIPRPGDTEHDRDPLSGELGRKIEASLKRYLNMAEDLVRENWFEVLSIAHALEAHKTLSGEDVTAVIECRQGPAVDGRIYATQEMRDQMVAYHELAAASLRHKATIDAPLPNLVYSAAAANGVTPVDDDEVVDGEVIDAEIVDAAPVNGDGGSGGNHDH